MRTRVITFSSVVVLAAFSPAPHAAGAASPTSSSPASVSAPAGIRDPEDRPNFILLFMDDLGYGDVGFTGHPTTRTPNIDRLAWGGKVLTTWYSGCAVCSGSRASLMTGRQYPRTGVPGVFGPTVNVGLPLNETTVAEQLKKRGYATGMVGKWHLGQRSVYLPHNRGFDEYLGIPFSGNPKSYPRAMLLDFFPCTICDACTATKDDMGNARATDCPAAEQEEGLKANPHPPNAQTSSPLASSSPPSWAMEQYAEMGFLLKEDEEAALSDDPAARHLPLVHQKSNSTSVLEQPLDFTHLAEKYNDVATSFIRQNKDDPFFLYLPFSHVHTTSGSQPEMQYAGCQFKNSTTRGPFGDALAEADWIVGNVMETLRTLGIEENTLVLFTSDNGPWLIRDLSGGSAGLLTGRSAGYWNTGKGSTWEGGIREPAFAYWKGKVEPFSRSSEIVSSMDVFPTLSRLAGVPLPTDRVFDGRDMTDVLLRNGGRSGHDFLFFYGACMPGEWSRVGIAAVRHGKYKAHFCTGPGIGGDHSKIVRYDKYPLLFDVEKDPSEAEPISTGELPKKPEDAAAMERIMKAHAFEKATFTHGTLVPEPDGPGEGPDRYGVCCDRSKDCLCNGDVAADRSTGILDVGSKAHHDRYHDIVGEDPPNPPTRAQVLLE